jgi:hypothetical protein
VIHFLLLLGICFLLMFQNCGPAFQVTQLASTTLRLSTPTPVPTSTPGPFDVLDVRALGAALYQTNCASCHGQLDVSTKKGRDATRIRTAIGSETAMSGIASLRQLSASDTDAIAFALANNNNLRTNQLQSNFSRSRVEVIALRLREIFPDFDSTPMTDGSNSLAKALGQPDFFTQFATSMPTSVLAQHELRRATVALCRGAGGTSRLFATSGILLSGESFPSDKMTLRAFTAARNGWLYPFSITSPEVIALRDLGRAVITSGGGVQDVDEAICTSVFSAPQFWLGTPGEFEIFKRIALDIGHRLPRYTEYNAVKNGLLKPREYLRQIQSESGYIGAVKTWHREWLTPMDFTKFWGRSFNGGPFWPSRLRGTRQAAGGPALYGGSVFLAETPKGALDPTIPVIRINGSNTTSLGQSEGCQDVPQPFNPHTERLQWEHFVDGSWYIVGGWKKVGGIWQMFNGRVQINSSLVGTSVADIRFTPSVPGGKYHYLDGKLAALPAFPANFRRLRRFTTPTDVNPNGPSPPQEQNGYSTVKLWWSGKPVYVCNSLTRFLATCAFRPQRAIPISYKFREWVASNGETLQFFMGGTGSASVDAFAHPNFLEQAKCWIDPSRYPDATRVPTDGTAEAAYSSTGNLNNVNQIATNLELHFTGSIETQMARFPSLKAEIEAWTAVSRDMREEPVNLVADIVEGNLDYRQLLTANWTVGTGPLELMYRTQGQYMMAYPPGLQDLPGNSNYNQLRVIRGSDFQPIPASWLISSLANYPVSPLSGYLLRANPTTSALHPRAFSGVLTQPGFMAPGSQKMRTIAARILRTFTCDEVNSFAPTAEQTALHLPFVPKRESGGQHVDPTKSCIKCHINMDPLASALSPRFLDSLNFSGQVRLYAPSEVVGNATLGILSDSTARSHGALFGHQVQGVEEVGRVLANSPQFARCAVLQAFRGVIGREPVSNDDHDLIDRVTNEWMSQGYRYNDLVEKLVLSSVFQRRN